MAVRAFSPPERSCALEPFAGRLRDDLDAALERIVFVEQREAGAAAAEQRAERLLEVLVDRGERVRERWRVVSSIRLDRLAGLRDRIDQVLALRRQERVARFELVELLDGGMFTGPSRSIFARSAVIASSALNVRCMESSVASRQSSVEPPTVPGRLETGDW